MRLDKPLTFPRMAVEIGWAQPGMPGAADAGGRSLLRLCLRREDEIAKRFVIRDRRNRPDKVTLGAITRYLPELRPSRVDAIADSFRGYLTEVDKRATESARLEVQKLIRPALERIAEMERRLAGLSLAPTPRRRRRKRRRNRPPVGPRGTTRDHS